MRKPRPARRNALSPAQLRQRAEEAAHTLPPLLVKAERVATIVAQGVHGRRRAGTGDSFWQYRRYQAGDPVQIIDWRQSAKAQTAYVRENEWESAQNVYFWVDRTASMGWRSRSNLPTKAERAAVLALALASLLLRGGERVAFLGSGQRPAKGRSVLSRLVGDLTRDHAGRRDGLPPVEALRRHSRIVLIGDFLDAREGIEAVIRRFSGEGHRGHVLQVRDPAEEVLPFRGRNRFRGLENEGTILIGRVETLAEEYASYVEAENNALSHVCRAAGWSYTRNFTDRPMGPVLLSLHMLMSETEIV